MDDHLAAACLVGQAVPQEGHFFTRPQPNRTDKEMGARARFHWPDEVPELCEFGIAAEGELGQAVGRLMMVMEAYPNLRAQDNISTLMEELSSTENRIAFSRQHYNDSVLGYNNAVQSFPANLVANAFGFQPAEYFEVPEAETKPIKVDLR